MQQPALTHKEIRALLGRHYRTVRIKRDGSVHVFGRMPNTSDYGWFFYAWDSEVAARLWGEAGQ